MLARALTLTVIFFCAGAIVQVATRRDPSAPRSPLTELPKTIEGWRGFDAAPFADDVVATLGVDDYVNRRYERSGLPISVYIGYYANQRSGDAIHSPRNCLPGTGWQPVASGPAQIHAGERSVTVARYEIAKGLDRQVVLYWYQGRGRVVAGEYANKAWLMLDAARSGRSNGGLVRLIAPVVTTPEAALDELSAFAAALLPHLPGYLP
jgi:EpsI family protein